MVDYGPPQPGDTIEALEDGPFLTKGWTYLCLDVRASPTAEKRTSPLLRVEYASEKSPNRKVFGPPIDRFRVVHRPGFSGEVFVVADPDRGL